MEQENRLKSLFEDEIKEQKKTEIEIQKKTLDALSNVEENIQTSYSALGDEGGGVFLSHKIESVEIKDLMPNPKQSRLGYSADSFFADGFLEHLEDSSVKKLAASIQKHGLLQPIIVSKIKKIEKVVVDGEERETIHTKNMVIVGHRRVLAHILLGRTHINAIRIDYNPSEYDLNIKLAQQNLTENLERKNINPMDMAFLIKDLSEEFTIKEICEKFGMSTSLAYRYLSLIDNLIQAIQVDVAKHTGKINYNVLYEISLLPKNKQAKAYELVKLKDHNVLKKIKEMRTEDNDDLKKISRIGKVPLLGNKALTKLVSKHKDEFLAELNEFVKEFLRKKGHHISFRNPRRTKAEMEADEISQAKEEEQPNVE